jgi:hypothetical protein
VARLSALAFDPVLPRENDQPGAPSHQYFYYRPLDDQAYHLFSKGWDGKPFTDDDIYPDDITGLDGYRTPTP